jgi:predicted dehydrogenase
MKKVRVGLIGCGGISKWSRIPGYRDIKNAQVVATCDVIPERAKETAKALKAKHAFTDYRDVIALKDVDMIDICTPNYLHSEIAVAALNAGKHVFTEKPDAISVDKALAMKAAAQKSGKHLMAMRNYRFVTSFQYIRDYVAEGKCGDLYAGRCGWIRRRGIPGMGGWFTTKAMSGGGPVIDLGVHMIDVAMWVMGNPKPVAVSGTAYNKFADKDVESDQGSGDKKEGGIFDVEDLAMGFIKFENGASLQFEFSWASNIEKEHGFLEMRGSKAGFKWEMGELTLFTDDNVSVKPMIKPGKMAHTENLRHFIDDVIIGGKEPIFTPEQGVNMIKILTSIYESAETGKEILL